MIVKIYLYIKELFLSFKRLSKYYWLYASEFFKRHSIILQAIAALVVIISVFPNAYRYISQNSVKSHNPENTISIYNELNKKDAWDSSIVTETFNVTQQTSIWVDERDFQEFTERLADFEFSKKNTQIELWYKEKQISADLYLMLKSYLSILEREIFFVKLDINEAKDITYVSKSNSSWIVSPLYQISKPSCKEKNFHELEENCKQILPLLRIKDYQWYLSQSDLYVYLSNIYTTLWWSSYRYWWDIWGWWNLWIDIATSKWTPVYSMADGIVIRSEYALGWWNVISIEHQIHGKKVVSNYSNLSKIDVSLNSEVKAGMQIWEVGESGNLFWTHLHFQIDLDTPFHPYYYSYDSCPYSFTKILELGVCFNELRKNTIDPILFLETNWYILYQAWWDTLIDNKILKETPEILKKLFNE